MKSWQVLYVIGMAAYVLTVLALLKVIDVRAAGFFVVMVFCLCAGAIIRGTRPRRD